MNIQNLPTHIAIIMDGNGRWAKRRGLSRSVGHQKGLSNMLTLCEYARQLGIHYLTVYALSTENMSRPKEELDALFSLFRQYFAEYMPKMLESSINVKFIGDRTIFPSDMIEMMAQAELNWRDDNQFTFTIALNYGARDEIIRATKKMIEAQKVGGPIEFSTFLDTYPCPDPDLIIRTGGEVRLSNFLLFQSAYSEFYFTKTYFPSFSKREFLKAIKQFSRRDRRYGRVKL